MIKVINGRDNRIKVTFPYNPDYIVKIKTINGYRWHPEEKYWSVPYTNGILEKILKIFEKEKIHIDPALQVKTSIPVIARSEATKQSLHNFEDLRRELISRKYSHKTVKVYIYTHVSTKNLGKIKSPLDSLNLEEGGDD
ncbi:MAG: hypothetical protein QMC80_07415 [Thermoplasmatales archaeon]|nr:hypothetical protein [Thermoplasmatales archaeon]